MNFLDEADFVEITFSNNPLVNFTSNPSSFRQCFDVNITDDEVLEDTERFSLRLTLNDTSGQRLNIIIDPDMSSVEIVDTDGIYITCKQQSDRINFIILFFSCRSDCRL